MQLGPESERPTKVRVFRDDAGAIQQERLKLTDEEWQEHIQRGIDHDNKKKEYAKTKYLDDREEAYKKEIYPRMDEARLKESLENDSTLVNELRVKKADIDAKYPAPA